MASMADGARTSLQSRSSLWIAGIVLFVLLVIFSDAIAPYSATRQNLQGVLRPPDATHLFGTDQFGRDVFSRVLVGSQTTLSISVAATLLGLALGIPIGLAAGYAGGIRDELSMRVMDALLSFPPLLLALLVLASLGPSSVNVVIAVALVFAAPIARVIRGAVIPLRNSEFVAAAILRGESTARILFSEIAPNLATVIRVETCIRFSYAIQVTAALGFLGLGSQPPSSDWGLQIGEGRQFLLIAPWVVLWPAAAIFLAVVGANLLVNRFRPEAAGRQAGDA